MVAYHGEMVVKALPDEAPDMTVNELHERVLSALVAALRIALGNTGLVLSEIFLRTRSADTGEERQVSADALIVPDALPRSRTVYRVPEEPAPAVTVEILSPSNLHGEGRDDLERKRDLFDEIGVGTHLEIDPDPAHPGVDVWERSGGSLRLARSSTAGYDGPALYGVHLTFDENGEIHIWLPAGREYLGPAAEVMALERQGAELERQGAELERRAAEIERLTRRLRERGIDPAGP